MVDQENWLSGNSTGGPSFNHLFYKNENLHVCTI